MRDYFAKEKKNNEINGREIKPNCWLNNTITDLFLSFYEISFLPSDPATENFHSRKLYQLQTTLTIDTMTGFCFI